MANTFLTPKVLAEASVSVLENKLYTGAVMEHTAEKELASKVGDTVDVRVATDLGEARDFMVDGKTIPEPVNQRSVPVTLTNHFYKRVDLTSKERSLELSDFTRDVLTPAIDSIILSIEKGNIKALCAGAGGFSGSTPGTRPSTLKHLAMVNKWFTDHRIKTEGRYGFVDSVMESELLQLDQFTAGTYGQDGPPALREAILARRMGIDWITNPLLESYQAKGSATKAAATAAGALTMVLSGVTANAVIPMGSKFTTGTNGSTVTYTVALDAVADGDGNATVALTQPVPAAIAANAAITWLTYSQNIAFQRAATAMAIVAPAPLPGMQSAVGSYKGVSMRVSMDGDITSLSSALVVDVFYGAKVINPDGVVIMTA